MKIAVVTPTIGTKHLKKCLESVSKQTYQNFIHYIFVDGKEHEQNVLLSLPRHHENIRMMVLPENIGKGWYGHRVYAACPFLINADVICYLDEDNWYEPDHLEGVYRTLSTGNSWAYAFRKIYRQDESFVCEDNCESLGKHSVFFDDSVFHVDTSCFAVRKDIAVKLSPAWYNQWGADRIFLANLSRNFKDYSSTGKYSVCYRLDGNPNSVTEEFFLQGNRVMLEKYPSGLPWKFSGTPLDKEEVLIYNTDTL